MGAVNGTAKTQIVSGDILGPSVMFERAAMSNDVSNRVAMVTGAAGGLGSVVTRLLAETGHDLALVDLPGDGLSVVRKELEGLGATVVSLPADLAQVSECE